jgi:aspartokinase
LAEIIVSLSEDVTFTPGVIATISFELARNKVNILEYFTSTPHTIVIVSEKDALKGYRLLQKLASSQEKQT